MDQIRRFAVWSNAAYIAPLAAAFYFQLWILTAALAALVAASSLYHVSKESKFIAFDIAAAVIVAALYAYSLYLADLSKIALALIFIFVVIDLAVRYLLEAGNRGSIAHGAWHVLVATTLLIATLAIT